MLIFVLCFFGACALFAYNLTTGNLPLTVASLAVAVLIAVFAWRLS